jgi:hypothetical protein
MADMSEKRKLIPLNDGETNIVRVLDCLNSTQKPIVPLGASLAADQEHQPTRSCLFRPSPKSKQRRAEYS